MSFIFGGDKIKGTLVLMQKSVLDINSLTDPEKILDGALDGFGSILDTLTSFLGASVCLQLISATKPLCKFSFEYSAVCFPFTFYFFINF